MEIPAREAKESGREYALRALKDNIIHLTLVPGSKVSENELSAQLGLSRTPVREALMELGKVGIVDIQPQRYSTIARIDYTLVDEACLMRSALECAMVERAAQMITPEQKNALEENLLLQRYHLSADRKESLWTLDNAFHQLLFSIARCAMTYQMMTGFTIHFDRVRNMSLGGENHTELFRDHEAVARAVCDGNAEEAKRVMKSHLNRYRIDRKRLWRKYPSEYFVTAP